MDASSGCVIASIARKLEHPLLKIRQRALSTLLFKLRQELVNLETLPRTTVDALVYALLQCLNDVQLEVDVLHILEYLVQSGTIHKIHSALQYYRAVDVLHRCAIHTHSELRPLYDKVTTVL